MNENKAHYVRKVTSFERMLSYAPFAVVTMVLRINGDITLEQLTEAVGRVQARHLNLRVRLEKDEENNLWFTTENVKDIPVEEVTREDKDQWLNYHVEASKVPFEFEERPAIRFYLLKSQKTSEIIILCHHLICDGLSLAYLARDLMTCLGDPEQEIEALPDPAPINLDNMPKDVGINPIAKYFINRINQQWSKEPVAFDMEDYRCINEAYWDQAQHRAISIELTEPETQRIVQRSREEGVTVNSTLTTAFVGAQQLIQGNKKELTNIGVAANLRDRLPLPAGETMGFYAGVVTINYSYDEKKSFWDNTRGIHSKITPLIKNKYLFMDALTWCYMNPEVLEAINFKRLGSLVSADSPRYEKLSTFAERKDNVSSILKREKMDSLDQLVMGSAVTNLTRMDFPTKYGELELDRLMMNPGGAFPLSTVNLVLGAVTCSGKLSLLVEYDERTVDTETIHRIKEKAFSFLLPRSPSLDNNMKN